MVGCNDFEKRIIPGPEMSLILCERPIENSARFNKIAIRSNSTIYFFSVWTEFRQILGAIQSGRDANCSCKMLEVFRLGLGLAKHQIRIHFYLVVSPVYHLHWRSLTWISRVITVICTIFSPAFFLQNVLAAWKLVLTPYLERDFPR